MKREFIDPFTTNLPYIDLHGFDRDSARVAINDFINDNYMLKNSNFYIIHGKGSGIVKKTVIDTLQRNKMVVEYKIGQPNIGCTIVWIQIDK